MHRKKLKNPVALVTGGSRGIGQGVCLELARHGYAVAINFAGNEEAARHTQFLIGGQSDTSLVGSLFAKQGLQTLPVSDALRSEYFAAARAAREQLGEQLVPTVLLQRVQSILVDYSSERTP